MTVEHIKAKSLTLLQECFGGRAAAVCVYREDVFSNAQRGVRPEKAIDSEKDQANRHASQLRIRSCSSRS